MALLVTKQVVQTGLTPALVAAAGGGDTMECGERNFLHVKTAGTGATVTIDSVTPCSQGADHNLAVVLAATAEAFIGPINPARFAQPNTGYANITYSQVTTVTVEVVAM